jgi:DNA ligase 1
MSVNEFIMPQLKKLFLSGGKMRKLWQYLSNALILLALCMVYSAQVGAKSAPDIVLANVLSNVLDERTDVTAYLVSEKFDGVRAVWDGKDLRFRSGRSVIAPAWFIAKLPATPLDGELWLARGKFDELSGIVRKAQPIDDEWRKLSYLIFELPGAKGTFAQRYTSMQDIVSKANWPQLKAVEQYRVASRAALKLKLNETVKAGGEGLMLHLADAMYVTGRSDVLLKLKPLRDTEAQVLAHIPGKGKYTGMLGALQMQTPEGKRFKLGTGFSDEQRKSPPPIGSTVTYTYRDLTKTGLPRFASFVRVREEP